MIKKKDKDHDSDSYQDIVINEVSLLPSKVIGQKARAHTIGSSGDREVRSEISSKYVEAKCSNIEVDDIESFDDAKYDNREDDGEYICSQKSIQRVPSRSSKYGSCIRPEYDDRHIRKICRSTKS